MTASKYKRQTPAELREKHAAETRKEELIRICLAEHATGNVSFRDLSKRFGIPYQTLSGRFSGKKSALVSRERYMRFSITEEQLLEHVLKACTHPLSKLPRSFFYNVISMYLSEVKNNCSSSSHTAGHADDPVTISRAWISGFLTRHPDLQARVARSAGPLDQKTVQAWFDEFHSGLADRRIRPRNLYNLRVLDDFAATATRKRTFLRQGTYFASSSTAAAKSPSSSTTPQTSPVTVLEATCADGTGLPPYVLTSDPDARDFTALSSEVRAAGLDWEVAASEAVAGPAAALPTNWLVRYFDPLTKRRLTHSSTSTSTSSAAEEATSGGDEWRGLVLESDVRHVSFEFLQYAADHRIALFFIPPDLAALLLPLEVGSPSSSPANTTTTTTSALGALRRQHEREFLHQAVLHRDWHGIVSALADGILARQHADPYVVRSSWRNAGLVPFDPSVVKLETAPLRKKADRSSSHAVSSSSASSTPTQSHPEIQPQSHMAAAVPPAQPSSAPADLPYTASFMNLYNGTTLDALPPLSSSYSSSSSASSYSSDHHISSPDQHTPVSTDHLYYSTPELVSPVDAAAAAAAAAAALDPFFGGSSSSAPGPAASCDQLGMPDLGSFVGFDEYYGTSLNLGSAPADAGLVVSPGLFSSNPSWY